MTKAEPFLFGQPRRNIINRIGKRSLTCIKAGRPNKYYPYVDIRWEDFGEPDDEEERELQDQFTRKEANRPVWKLLVDTDETPMASGCLMNQHEIRWMLRYHTLCIGSILQKIRNGDGFWICIEKKLRRKGESIYKLRRLTDDECRKLGFKL